MSLARQNTSLPMLPLMNLPTEAEKHPCRIHLPCIVSTRAQLCIQKHESRKKKRKKERTQEERTQEERISPESPPRNISHHAPVSLSGPHNFDNSAEVTICSSTPILSCLMKTASERGNVRRARATESKRTRCTSPGKRA